MFDVDILKRFLLENRNEIIHGKIRNNIPFGYRLSCADNEIRETFDQIIGEKGFQIKFFNTPYGFDDQPWYSTLIMIERTLTNDKNVYSFEGLHTYYR